MVWSCADFTHSKFRWIVSINNFSGWVGVFTSLGRTRTQFHLSVALSVGFVIAIYTGMRFGGILGVAYAYAAFTAPAGILNLYIAGQYMNLSVRTILLEVGRIFVIAALMGGVVFWFENMLTYGQTAFRL